MIYIVHGEDQVASRDYTLNLQKQIQASSKVEFLLTDTSAEKLLAEVSTINLFGETKLFILDVTGMGRTNVDVFIVAMEKVPHETALVIFSGKELSNANTFVKAASKNRWKVMSFSKKPSGNVFAFVDAVFNQNRIQAYKELQKLLLMGEDAIYLLTMLTYGLRSISYAKFNSSMFDKLSPFVKQKVKTQAQKFSEAKIIDIFELFYDFDKGMKTGEYDQNTVIPLAIEKVITYK